MKEDKKKKYLTFEDLADMEQNNEIKDAKSFWKAMLLGFIVNIMEVGDYKYKLTKEDIDKIAEDLWGNENIYGIIDSEISYALMDYEKKVRR